jgi:hypothetical protein
MIRHGPRDQDDPAQRIEKAHRGEEKKETGKLPSISSRRWGNN